MKCSPANAWLSHGSLQLLCGSYLVPPWPIARNVTRALLAVRSASLTVARIMCHLLQAADSYVLITFHLSQLYAAAIVVLRETRCACDGQTCSPRVRTP